MTQYALDISLPVAYTDKQFMISESNRLAHEWILNWANWPSFALYLQGEHGSGKTHLAHLWQERTQGVFLEPDTTELPNTAAIIDGLEQWKNEEAFFHLYNHCKLENIRLLITSSLMPDALHFKLPDVISRLKALPLVQIAAPDDALLEAVLLKHLTDRQLKISPETVAYMLPRLPRSFAELTALVDKLDSDSLASGRTLTTPYIKQICGW